MKKILLLMVFVGCAMHMTQAQETMYGIRGGLAYSTLNFDQSIEFDNESRIGAYVGGFADFRVSDSFYLMVEAQYSAEGAKDKPYRIDFIQFPIQLRYAVSNKFKIGVGPQFSVIAWDNQEFFSQYAASAVGSLEFLITDMIFVDFRYSLGLTNVLDENVIMDNEAKNSSVQIGVGIKL